MTFGFFSAKKQGIVPMNWWIKDGFDHSGENRHKMKFIDNLTFRFSWKLYNQWRNILIMYVFSKKKKEKKEILKYGKSITTLVEKKLEIEQKLSHDQESWFRIRFCFSIVLNKYFWLYWRWKRKLYPNTYFRQEAGNKCCKKIVTRN